MQTPKHDVIRNKVISCDVRLNRQVCHDSRSRHFNFDVSAVKVLQSVKHERHIPILDQGALGSCTGNAGIGALASHPLYRPYPYKSRFSLNQFGAIALYSAATMIDGPPSYPPSDVGSSGLSIAKVLLRAGSISSYQHTFNLDDALKALTLYPILVGMNWYQNMSIPDSDGRAQPKGKLLGGHELVARELDTSKGLVWFDNSWGPGWGVNGRFYLTYNDFKHLLSQQGDVIVLIPLLQPPNPTPAPPIKVVTDHDDVLIAAAMRTWLTMKKL